MHRITAASELREVFISPLPQAASWTFFESNDILTLGGYLVNLLK